MKFIATLLLIVALLFSYLIFRALQFDANAPEVLSDTDTVTVSASVNSCILNFTLYPEKRVPATGNWSNAVTLQIRNSVNVPLANLSFTTNNLGNAVINLCDQNIFLAPGTYNFSVAGLSHLRKNFNNNFAFSRYQTDVVRIAPSDVLLAGEVSVVYDNYINSLDLSYLVGRLYSSDIKADLNKDGLVNSLDLSNQVFNLYKSGDN